MKVGVFAQARSSTGDTSTLGQLLYCSRSRDGANSALEMSDILAQSRPRNLRDGITGVLTVIEGVFVQIVEGPPPVLDQLMGRLLRDPRHSDVTVIEHRTAVVRMFGDWEMISPRLAAGDLALLALLLDDERAGIEAYGRILAHAAAAQDRMIERRTASQTRSGSRSGRDGPPDHPTDPEP